MLRKSWAVALLVLPLPALAAEGVSYNYLEGNFVFDEQVDATFGRKNVDDDGDGFAAAASFAFSEMLFVNGSYTDASLDDSDLDVSQISVGVGAHSSEWTGAWDLFGVLSYEDFEFDSNRGSLDENGFGVAGGLRGMLSEALELNGAVQYVDVGDADGINFKVGGLWKFGTVWAATADYRTGDVEDDGNTEVDFDEIRVGLRYIF